MAVAPDVIPETLTGVELSAPDPEVPFPSSPYSSSPQHFTAPETIAHVWESPAAIAVTVPVDVVEQHPVAHATYPESHPVPQLVPSHVA